MHFLLTNLPFIIEAFVLTELIRVGIHFHTFQSELFVLKLFKLLMAVANFNSKQVKRKLVM